MRVAVVGAGFMGNTHAQAWLRIPGVEVSLVSRREWKRPVSGNLESGGAFDLGRLPRYETLDDALSDPRIGAFDICLPTDLHAETAMRVLDAGRDCLVEKPLALTVEAAERVASAGARSGRTLMCAQVLRFHPAYAAARNLIQGLGGTRTAFFFRRCAVPTWSEWMGDPAKSGGGAFDLLIHDADFARWVWGAPDEVWSKGASRCPGSCICSGVLGYAAGSDAFRVTIAGGWYAEEDYPFSMGFHAVCEGGVVEFERGTLRLNGEPVTLPETDMFESELREFAACVAEGRGSRICPVQESVEAVRLMRRIVDAE